MKLLSVACLLVCTPALAFSPPRLTVRPRPPKPTTPRSAHPTHEFFPFPVAADPAGSIGSSVLSIAPLLWSSIAEAQTSALTQEGSGYSKASYFATLFLYVLSFPGLWSLIKRSTKSKMVSKIYLAPSTMDDTANQVYRHFLDLNYRPEPSEEYIIFRGLYRPDRGQALFLTAMTFLSLATLALVLIVAEESALGKGKGLGNLWFLATLASPLAGKYYTDNAEREEAVRVQLQPSKEEGGAVEVSLYGAEEEIDRLWQTKGWREKGKEYVKGIFDK
ncbi:unnamed protein product [Vitrella brassicaformis CCMP3155]|uniref:Uncharacterized protein n=1 Tax=Vitrella brassicaformis (strain CCMP3155) TaxID=1169540 RepID=A0A0G4FXN5_VITBC|nr:unnamed protein product [Vitrella brassicaformis CCMP3155]|eukprot:CEM19626.1 unnamed protein product [Vitrella brassicaformis CCMP3155]